MSAYIFNSFQYTKYKVLHNVPFQFTLIILYIYPMHTSEGKEKRGSHLKSKITKILNSEENSKRKVPNEMAKSKAQTHQTNELQLL